MANNNAVVAFIRNDTIQKRIESLLDKRASQFTTSLITIANTNNKIAACEPSTVLNAALTAASMDLPLNPNLGFAYIVPYGNQAQFQMGWKGYVQLAQRSGQYRTIGTVIAYEGDTDEDIKKRLTSIIAPDPKSDKVVGYVAYFELLNGFEKTLYMSASEMEKHARRYSKSFNNGPWKTDYDKMAMKTVLKLLLNRFGPMSTELEQAIVNDQAIIHDDGNREYIDHDELDDVGATDEMKQAIINQNKPAPDNVDLETGEIKDESPAEDQTELVPPAPAPRKKSVKEQAAEWTAKHKAEAAAKESEGEADGNVS